MSTFDYLRKYWFLILTSGLIVGVIKYVGDASRGYPAIGGEDCLLMMWLGGWFSHYMANEEK